jgi:hypothetical protein
MLYGSLTPESHGGNDELTPFYIIWFSTTSKMVRSGDPTPFY